MTVIDGDRLTFRQWVRQLALPAVIVAGILILAGALLAVLGLG